MSALFGDMNNKEAVMSIINAFLPEHRKVIDIEYLPTDHQGPMVDVSKEFQYDFMCRYGSGTLGGKICLGIHFQRKNQQ